MGSASLTVPLHKKATWSNMRVYAHVSVRKPGVYWLVVFINRLLIASDIVAQVDIRVQRSKISIIHLVRSISPLCIDTFFKQIFLVGFCQVFLIINCVCVQTGYQLCFIDTVLDRHLVLKFMSCVCIGKWRYILYILTVYTCCR